MRSIFASAAAILVLSAQVQASPRTSDVSPRQVITVLLYVHSPERFSPDSFEALKAELRAMMETPDVRFEFTTPDRTKPPVFYQSLVSVQLAGSCSAKAQPTTDVTGPLAFAHSADGRILPFVEVNCDRVRRHISGAFWRCDHDRASYMYGRALARVLAHELYHVFTGRKDHTATGLTRSMLSGDELIADRYELEAFLN